MKRRLALPALLLSIPMFAGCGVGNASSESDASQEPKVSTEVSSDSNVDPSSSPSPSTSARGNLIKVLGESAGVLNYSGQRTVTFKVTDFSRNVKCTEDYAEKPENGELVALKMSVKTEGELAEDINGQITFDPFMWKYIDANGKTFNGDLGTMSTYSCLSDSEILADSIGPSEQAEGWVLLDLPTSDGILVYSYFGLTGWEYDLAQMKAAKK